ncbi:hypothetical protein GP486_003501 [Trichoglossum hirsutum]|uniref:Helicase C-terminal domain-containing protein n=1 Tax=Trichoglossum hirsutum TaxID=265104 RepID=A0A9P8LCS9_9PEZI|nr:hypothetical protein GP486_003501 [Trichoglossum hirsutum]
MLLEETSKDQSDPLWLPDDIENETLGNIGEDLSTPSRDDWLQRISQRQNLCTESSRVEYFLRLFRWLRTEYPDEKIVIFSSHLRYLDIVAEALRQDQGIEAIRFDETIKTSRRPAIQEEFMTSGPGIPLLITSGTGGVGLNIAHASIIIQLEPWWNQNQELQAITRLHRRGQTKVVKYICMEATNSDIDVEIICVQNKKVEVNEELMRPILRRHNEGPMIMDLLMIGGLEPMVFEELQSRDTDT